MAKTRLTRKMREQALASVMAATNFNKQKEDILKRAGSLARDLTKALIPAEFTEMIKGHPPEWFRHVCQLDSISREYAPGHAFREEWQTAWYGVSVDFEAVAVPMTFRHEVDSKVFSKLRKEADKLVEARNALRLEVRSFLQSCNTVEEVVEKMPELKPHIPEKEVFLPPMVNTNNVASLLIKAGFDNKVAA